MGWEISFPTWGAFLEHAENAPPHPDWPPRFSRTVGRAENDSRQSNKNFFGAASFGEAIEAARYGWREGEARIRESTRRLVDTLSSRIARSDYVYAVEGLELDVRAYLTGRPECWLQEEHTMVEGPCVKHVRLVLNTGATRGVPSQSMEARGIGIAAAVLLLERAGARVTVDALSCCEVTGTGVAACTITVAVKSAEQELDEGRLAFAAAHPDMHRRIMFSVRETCPDTAVVSGIWDNYGTTMNPKVDCDLYMPGMREGSADQPCEWTSPADVSRWILKTLAEQGIMVEGA